MLDVISAECFSADDLDRDPVSGDELAGGVATGRVWVAHVENASDVVGFVYIKRPSDDHVHIESTAVAVAHRNRGNGKRLIQRVVAEHSADVYNTAAITVTVSPRNFSMLRVLCRSNFVGRVLFRDFIDSGKDRVYCQHKRHTEFIDPDDRYVLPAVAARQVDDLLRRDSYVLTDVNLVDGQDYLEISRFETVDAAALQAYEANTSVQFSSTLLAALTFLLGLAFSNSSDGGYPDSVRIMLVQATALTLGSTVVYANASGLLARMDSGLNLPRTRAKDFEQYMKWGNLLSEYGGVLPMFLVLPVAFASVSRNLPVAVVIGVVLSLLASAYELSPYALTHRYRRTKFGNFVVWGTVALPFLGAFAVHTVWAGWLWAGAATLSVYVRIFLNASASVRETVHTITGSGVVPDRYQRGARGIFYRRGPILGPRSRTRQIRPTPGGS